MSSAIVPRSATRGTTIEETGLSTREENSRELAVSSSETAARAEIEGAIIIAKRFPRNELNAFSKLIQSCQRFAFAKDTTYAFPRGGELIKGPSIYLAKECARIWGNIRFGCTVVSDDDEIRHIKGWAWDVETNTRVEYEDSFAKLVYRKKGGWQKPDERDLRELTNRRASILIRNCILSIMPPDLIDDAISESDKTIEKGVASDPQGHAKLVIKSFQALGVTVEDLEEYLGHALTKCSPAQITQLRSVYKSINDGNSKWSDYVGEPDKTPTKPATGAVSASDLTNPKVADHPEQSAPAAKRQPEPHQSALSEALWKLTEAKSITEINAIYTDARPLCQTDADQADLDASAKQAQDRIKAGRGPRANKPQGELLDTSGGSQNAVAEGY